MENAVPGSAPVLDANVSVFEVPEALAINAARLAHLESLALPLSGRSVIDIGCGVGDLARFFVERGCRITCVDRRSENVEILRSHLPGVETHVADVETESLAQFGGFDIVSCYGLLHHISNPLPALRNMAAACRDLLLLETIVTDHELPLLRLADEPRETPNQALAGLGSRPSPAFLAKALKQCGFDFIYTPLHPPDHPDFQFHWRNNLECARDGRNLRYILAASRAPLDNPNLTPVGADGKRAFRPEEALAEAQSLCWVRPLKPYPGWVFGSDWDNPDPTFQRRLDLWRYFNRHQLDARLDFEWYDGLKFWLYPGNDLGATLFVGGCNEPNECAFLDRFLRPGMVFVDAGANHGLYSLFASRRVGETGSVISFEPSARELERFRANIERNDLRNVTAYGIALADQNTEMTLSIAGGDHEGHNTLGAFVYPAVTLLRTEQVPVRTLDSVLSEARGSRVDLIKIDVEGCEPRLLEGAVKIIQKHRPVLLFEALDPALREQGSSREELFERVRSFGYVLYHFDSRTGLPTPVDDVAVGDLSANILAAPNEAPLAESWCARSLESSEPDSTPPLVRPSWLSRLAGVFHAPIRARTLFDLNTYSVCGPSQVSGSGPITVITPAEQWGYAIQFPVAERVRATLPAPVKVTIRVAGEIEAGRIGVGMIGADGSRYLAPEVIRGAPERRVVFELELPGIPKGASLVVRNTSPGPRASKIRIDALTAHWS